MYVLKLKLVLKYTLEIAMEIISTFSVKILTEILVISSNEYFQTKLNFIFFLINHIADSTEIFFNINTCDNVC